MRIAIITDTYHPDTNNVVNTISKLKNEFDDKSIIYKIYSTGDFRKNDSKHVFFKTVKVQFYDKLNFSFILYKKFKKSLDSFNPDLIHIFSEGILGVNAAKYSKENNIPYFASYTIDLHNYSKYYPFDLSKRTKYKYIKSIHSNAYLNLVPSNYSLNQLRSIDIDKNVKWPGGIDIKLYHPIEQKTINEKKKLLYVGEISKDNNIQLILDIAKELNRIGYHFELDIVGIGPLLDKSKNQDIDNINFTGNLSKEDLALKYRQSDVLLFASEYATHGRVIIEAMASGTPVISIYKGGVKDILIDSFNGYAVYDNTPDAFVDSIKRMFKDNNLYLDMCRNSRIHTLGKDWNTSSNELIEYYIMAMESK